MFDQEKKRCQMGIVGLGVMGRNLLLNIAEKGFSIAGYDRDAEKVEALRTEGKELKIYAASQVKEFVDHLAEPKIALILVPAGPAVDGVIADLIPFFKPGDIIIDAGNSHYTDTDKRIAQLQDKGITFLGVGISGGEDGARHGPSMMPGGVRSQYEKVQPILEAAAAKVKGEPCVAYLGEKSAGHYVKMVHNGIEYGLMELIAEVYDLMKRGLGLSNDQLRDTFREWNAGELSSYLLEITADIFDKQDDRGDGRLIDKVLDVARQKGTGKWTSESALELQVPTPTIDMAVVMRNLSMLEDQRKEISNMLPRPIIKIPEQPKEFVTKLKHALDVAIICTYAQGLAVLAKASTALQYHFDLESIARIWRGGCIIRSTLLEDIRTAYKRAPELSNILLDSKIAKRVMDQQEDLRDVIAAADKAGIPVSGLMTVLGYIDSLRSPWLPANLIQAQRDCFGAHTFQRTDSQGSFHAQWEKK